MSIVVSNITKKFGNQIAVNNISFEIKKNEVVGFLGPNGAGKSTTMKMITGYLPMDAGDIQVCHRKVETTSTFTKSKIGYLPEANPLYLDMYVKEYLQFVANVYQIKDSNKKILETIDLVGLTPEAHKKIGQLSKGYKQRTGIAAALIHNPEVLILDEPTSGLDPNQIIEIREVIKRLGKSKTILFSSHIMQEVEAICERVIIINKGNIVADDQLVNLQKNQKSQHAVFVEYREVVHTNTLNELKNFNKIHAINSHSLTIETTEPELLKKEILEFSLRKNLNIISLQSEKKSLEHIFKELTK